MVADFEASCTVRSSGVEWEGEEAEMRRDFVVWVWRCAFWRWRDWTSDF